MNMPYSYGETGAAVFFVSMSTLISRGFVGWALLGNSVSNCSAQHDCGCGGDDCSLLHTCPCHSVCVSDLLRTHRYPWKQRDELHHRTPDRSHCVPRSRHASSAQPICNRLALAFAGHWHGNPRGIPNKAIYSSCLPWLVLGIVENPGSGSSQRWPKTASRKREYTAIEIVSPRGGICRPSGFLRSCRSRLSVQWRHC